MRLRVGTQHLFRRHYGSTLREQAARRLGMIDQSSAGRRCGIPPNRRRAAWWRTTCALWAILGSKPRSMRYFASKRISNTLSTGALRQLRRLRSKTSAGIGYANGSWTLTGEGNLERHPQSLVLAGGRPASHADAHWG